MWRKLLLTGLVLSFAFTAVFAADVSQKSPTEKALYKYDQGQALSGSEKVLIQPELVARHARIQNQLMEDARQNYDGTLNLRSTLSEGFEGDFLPAGWSMIDVDGGSAYNKTFSYIDAFTGTYGAQAMGCNDDYLITPKLAVTDGDNTFSFWFGQESTSKHNSFEVMVSTSGTEVADFVQVLDSANVPGAAGTWRQVTVDLSAYNTQNIYVALHTYYSESAYYDFGFDDITGPEIYVEPVPPLAADEPLPVDAAIDVTLDQMLSWAASFGADGYDLSFGTDNPPTNVMDAADLGDVLTYAPTLAYSTTYYWTVTPYNAYGDATGAAVWSFTTMDDPAIVAFPHTEGFEGDFPPAGWSVVNNNDDSDTWIKGTYSLYAHTGSGTAQIYTDYNSANDDWLITPPIDLSGDAKRVKFWVRSRTVGEPDEMQVLLSSGTSAIADFTTTLMPSTLLEFDDHTEFAFDLTAYAGGDVYIAFVRNQSPADGYYINLDDVTIEDIPTNPVVAIDPLNVDFGYIPNGASASFDVTIANSGGADLVIAGLTVDAPFSATYSGTISPESSEVVTVSFDPVAEGDFTGHMILDITGSFTGDDSVALAGAAYAPLTSLMESFEDEMGWTVIDNNDDGDTWDMDYSTNPHTGDEVAAINTDINGGSNDDYLVSPLLSLAGGQRLSYWYRVQSSGEPNDFQVLLSTTGNAPADFTDTLVAFASYSNTDYMMETIDLSAYTAEVYIAFHVPAGGLDGWRLYIDDVTIEDIPIVPIVSLSEETLDFGQIVQGGSASFDIMISNPAGGADMVVTDLTVTGPFSATYSGTIAVDTSAIVTVNFDPTEAGDFSGTLTVNVDGAFLGINTMDLMGSAYPDDYVFEDFESGELGYGWEVLPGTGTDWSVYSSSYYAFEGTYSLKGPYNSSGGDSWMLLPKLRLGTGDFLSFMLDGSSTSNTDLEVYVSTAGNTIADFTVLLDSYEGGVNQPADYELIEIDLSAYDNMDVFVALRVVSTAGYTNLYLDNFLMPPGAPNDNTPFFSEYMEGSGNNKGLEIYNLTGAILNLDEYQIAQSSGGGGWELYHAFPAGATLANADLWVIVTDQSFPEMQAMADEVLAYNTLDKVVHYNGDDARALIHIVGTDTTIMDVIGIPDVDPGSAWDVAGVVEATNEQTLMRKYDVETGNTNWAASAGTTEEDSEWMVLEQDHWYGIGYHMQPYPMPGDICELAFDYGSVNDLAVVDSIESYGATWYTFYNDGTYDNVIVSLCGSEFDTKLEVWGDCDTSAYLAYNDDFCSTQSEIDLGLLPEGEYLVKVYGYSSNYGEYTLSIIGTNGMPDFVVGDIEYYGQDTLDVTITNIGEADSPGFYGTDYHGLYVDGIYQGYLAESDVALMTGESHVYQVTGLNYDVLGSGVHQILIEADVDNDVEEFDETNNLDSLDIDVLVPPATPRHLMAMASGEQINLTWDPAPEEALEMLVPLSGVVDRKIKDATDSPEVLQKWASINANNSSALRETGDDCTDPFIIGSLPFTDSTTTAGFANSFTYGNGNDVVYKVTIAEAGYLLATTCSGTTGDTKLEIYAADCVTMLDQNDDECGVRSVVSSPVEAGDYLIVVDGYYAGDVAFMLDVSFSTTPLATDLTVSDMWVGADTVYAAVSNIGSLPVFSGPSCHWFVDGVDVAYGYTGSLGAGASDTLTLVGLNYAAVGPGDFVVRLEVDFWDSEVESDETNNMDSITVTIDEPDYVPVYNVYRDMTLVAEGVEPIDFAFSGGFVEWGLPVGDYCYQVTQMLPDSTESGYSNESCASITPNTPLGLTLEVNPDATATLNWMAPLPPGELKYDDGSAESWMSINTPTSSDHLMALRFNSPLAEYNISNIAIFGITDEPTTFENLYITGGDGTGSPDMNNILFTAPAVPVNGTWETGAEWTMVPADVASEVSEFFVVAQWNEGSEIGPYVGTDDDTETDRSFWSMDEGVTWNPWASTFMIRAFIELGGEVVSVGPTEPIIRNISTVSVPAMVNTTVEAPAFGLVSTERSFLGSFKVHRGTESGVYDSVLVADLAGTMYMDAPPIGETPYFYAVSANYDEGDSPFTNEVSYTPEALAWLDLDINMEDMFIEFEFGDTQYSTGFDLLSIGLDTLDYSIEYHAPVGRVVTREIDGAHAYGTDLPPAAGTTVDLSIYIQNDSQDAEWIDSVTVTWPAGITVNSSTDLVVVTAETHYLTTNSATGDGATIEWMNHDGGYGNIWSTELAMATVNVTIDASYTGDVYFDYYLFGDVFGSDPHEIGGSFVYMLPAFSVDITPHGTMLLPDSTAEVAIDVIAMDYHAGFYPGTISIFNNAVNAPEEIVFPFDVYMAPAMGVLSGVVTSGFDGSFMQDVYVGAIETNSMQEYFTMTAPDGTYILDLPAGNYDVGMGYEDFHPVAMNVDVEYNLTTVLDITMAPDIPAPVGLTAMEDGDVYLHWNLPVGPGDAMSESFESGAIPGNWTAVDADADGHNWAVWSEMARTGTYSLSSFSYSNTDGALTPNNYLVTPPLQMDGASELSFWVAASDVSWFAEHLQVKISTTGATPTDFVDVVLDYTLTSADWTEMVVDLSAYAGETALIAWVHNDVTDQYNLSMDDINLVNSAGTVMFSSDFEDPEDIEQFQMIPFRTDDMTDAQIDNRLAEFESAAEESALRSELLNFNIYSSVDGAAWGMIGTSDTLGYVDESVMAAQVIQYAVSAVYDLGESALSDTVTIAVVGVDHVGLPTSYALEQNYPNPFNPITFINYQLPEAANVRIVIYNVLGQNVATLVDQNMNAGYHNISWSGLNYAGTSVSSGVYLYRIESENFTDVKKLMFLK